MADNEVSSLEILLQAWLVSPDLYLNIISYKLPTLTFFIILEFVNITGRIFSTLNHKVSVSLRSKILDDGRRQWCSDQWIELSRTDCHESSHLARMNWVLVKMWTRMMRERVFGRRVATLITRLCLIYVLCICHQDFRTDSRSLSLSQHLTPFNYWNHRRKMGYTLCVIGAYTDQLHSPLLIATFYRMRNDGRGDPLWRCSQPGVSP